MNYWDQFVAFWGASMPFWLVIIGMMVILVGGGLIVLGISLAVNWWQDEGGFWFMPGVLMSLLGLAVLIFGIPFVNWLGVVWGVFA